MTTREPDPFAEFREPELSLRWPDGIDWDQLFDRIKGGNSTVSRVASDCDYSYSSSPAEVLERAAVRDPRLAKWLSDGPSGFRGAWCSMRAFPTSILSAVRFVNAFDRVFAAEMVARELWWAVSDFDESIDIVPQIRWSLEKKGRSFQVTRPSQRHVGRNAALLLGPAMSPHLSRSVDIDRLMRFVQGQSEEAAWRKAVRRFAGVWGFYPARGESPWMLWGDVFARLGPMRTRQPIQWFAALDHFSAWVFEVYRALDEQVSAELFSQLLAPARCLREHRRFAAARNPYACAVSLWWLGCPALVTDRHGVELALL